MRARVRAKARKDKDEMMEGDAGGRERNAKAEAHH